MKELSRIFQFIIFPLIGLGVAVIGSVIGGSLVIAKYSAALALVSALFR